MNILIAYASSEGQTRKIAAHVADGVRAAHHAATLFDTGDRAARCHVADFDRVILAGSVHQTRHQEALEVFIAGAAAALSKRPTLLLSVSLSAAQPDGAEDAQSYIAGLTGRTGFKPGASACVAGAIRMGEYDWFKTQIIRHLVLPGKKIDTRVDNHEFTDWDALDRTVDAFLT